MIVRFNVTSRSLFIDRIQEHTADNDKMCLIILGDPENGFTTQDKIGYINWAQDLKGAYELDVKNNYIAISVNADIIEYIEF